MTTFGTIAGALASLGRRLPSSAISRAHADQRSSLGAAAAGNRPTLIRAGRAEYSYLAYHSLVAGQGELYPRRSQALIAAATGRRMLERAALRLPSPAGVEAFCIRRPAIMPGASA